MSETTHSRRAALGALAVVPAVVMSAIPAWAGVATGGGLSSHPDAELFGLIDAARAAEARYRAASVACDEAEKRTVSVARDALIVTEEDTRLWKLKAGDPFDGAHLDLMRRRQAHRQNAKYLTPFSVVIADAPYMATLDDKDRALVEKMAAMEAREDQLVAAQDQWKESRQLAMDRSGETAAEERLEQLYNEKCDACDRIALKRALTLSGILAKLAFVAPGFDAQEELDGGTSEVILTSIAVDYKLGVEGVVHHV